MTKPDALGALQKARRDAMDRAKEEKDQEPKPPSTDLSEAECFVRLMVEMYVYRVGIGMGALPDGSAIWLRVRVPDSSSSPYAGMVAFIVSDDSLSLLQKAVLALEASPQSKWWKKDQWAQGTTS